MCTSPLKGFINGTTENGKKNLVVTPYSVDHIELLDGKKIHVNTPAITSKYALTEFVEIPCGQCIECRLQRSRHKGDF